MADRLFYPPKIWLEPQQLLDIPGVVDSCHNRPVRVDNAVELREAEKNGIGFVKDNQYRDDLRQTRIAAVFVTRDIIADVPAHTLGLVCDNPRICFAKAATLIYPFIHDTVPAEQCAEPIAPSVRLGKQVRIGRGVIIGKNVRIGDYSQIGDYSVIGDHCQIGDRARIGRHNCLEYSLIGDDFACGHHNTFGAKGFAFEPTPEGMFPVPQLGLLRIGNGVRFSDGCSVDRGALGDTIISDHVQIESQCKIAHNVSIGAFSIMTGQVAISGSVKIGSRVQIAGKVGFKGAVTVGDGAVIMAHAAVTKDVAEGETVFGVPAMKMREFVARQYALAKLTRNG